MPEPEISAILPFLREILHACRDNGDDEVGYGLDPSCSNQRRAIASPISPLN